jgi:hypothetical protein
MEFPLIYVTQALVTVSDHLTGIRVLDDEHVLLVK